MFVTPLSFYPKFPGSFKIEGIVLNILPVKVTNRLFFLKNVGDNEKIQEI